MTDVVFCVQVCSRGATRGTARWRSAFDAWRSSRPNCMWRRTLALETLRGAVDEYAGPIMDERTRTKLVRKRCVKPFDKRKADADDYIERVRSMVEPQRAEWRRKCECLVRFASRAARVRDARRHEAEAIHADNFANLAAKRAEHETTDDTKEAAFATRVRGHRHRRG